MRRRALALALLFLLALFVSGCGGVPESAEPEEIDIEAAQEAYLEWEKRVMDVHTVADEVMETYDELITAVSEGRYDIFSTYDFVSNELIPANNNLEQAMRAISPGDALSREHQETLNSAGSDLSYAIYWRTKAFEVLLEFLDAQQPSQMSDIRGNLEFSNERMVEGTAKYLSVKAELGLLEEGDAQE